MIGLFHWWSKTILHSTYLASPLICFQLESDYTPIRRDLDERVTFVLKRASTYTQGSGGPVKAQSHSLIDGNLSIGALFFTLLPK